MKIFLLSLIMLIIANVSLAKTSDLNEYRWENRILLLFAPDSSHADYVAAQRLLEQYKAGLVERHLLVFSLFQQGESLQGDASLAPEFVSDLWKTYEADANGLTTILIGKDGGEKLRQTGKMDLDEIFRRIDAMPMRRAEMREAQEK